MTTEHEASRTLVKSPPELWAECSDAGSLARHLGEFGEIAITRLDPETTVAWEGERVSGTVRIEPSGWGTKVTLTAETKLDEPEGVMETHDESPHRGPKTPDPHEATAAESPPQAELRPPPDQEENDAKVEETLEDADPEPVADSSRARARWRRLTGRMRGLFGPAESLVEADPPRSEETADLVSTQAEEREEPEVADVLEPPDPTEGSEPMSEPVPPGPDLDAEAILTSALDSLGQAHHRPFSRA